MDCSRKARGNKSVKKGFLGNWIKIALRLIVGGIFFYSGFLKLRNPQEFADSIFTFQLLSGLLIAPLALALPLLEIIVGVMLFIGWKVRPAAFSVFLLTIIFALTLTQAIIRGLEVDCGCFGSGEPSTLKTWVSLGRGILLMAAAAWIYGLAFPRKEGSFDLSIWRGSDRSKQ